MQTATNYIHKHACTIQSVDVIGSTESVYRRVNEVTAKDMYDICRYKETHQCTLRHVMLSQVCLIRKARHVLLKQ